ncbi:nuclear factor 7, ovary-like [Anoplopoma fimbria]|uniref:nuclear factor 7, ovary-like n=1 Tax=Anoplopoma fimbria TaxID=229290 RepID=UPI0023EB42CF|nr:nuclear factor 7, ovary-like [Anoplopoma fimbria]
MASRSEEDLCCPLCSDIFKDPVRLSCSHSFCKDCLQGFWAESPKHECPVCKRRSSKDFLPLDFALKSQCEAFLQERASEPLCSLHSKKLCFLCLDDGQLVCADCMDAETHRNQKFTPVHEAARDRKKELRDSLKPLQMKLTLVHRVKGNCDQTAEHIKVQTESTMRRIKEEFKRLHQFLDEEEEARMVALREEEERKSQVMKEKIDSLSRDITALSDTIRSTEKELRAEDVQFLQNYEAAVERVQQQHLPQLVPGALIDVAKHLGNLNFDVWRKMKEMVSWSPVILDPNSAHPSLVVSDDLTGVRCGETEQQPPPPPDNPERIDHFISVVGSEGFNSGSHIWEVEVGSNEAFVLGVLTESSERKGIIWPGLWKLMFCGGEYKALSPSDTGTDVEVAMNPRRIRVHLDWDGGRLSFSDPDTDTHMYTFTHTFADRLFPYISTWSKVPLKIVAKQPLISLNVQ